jgi:hypothetical protein
VNGIKSSNKKREYREDVERGALSIKQELHTMNWWVGTFRRQNDVRAASDHFNSCSVVENLLSPNDSLTQ